MEGVLFDCWAPLGIHEMLGIVCMMLLESCMVYAWFLLEEEDG